MQSAFQLNQCQKHKEVFIAIDISPKNDERSRHCCAQCLKHQNKDQEILTYKEADQYLRQKKKQFKESKEFQIKQNLDILHQLDKNIVQIKDHYISILEAFASSIKQQIAYIQEDSQLLDTKLSEINIESYLLGNNQFSQPTDNLKGFIFNLESLLNDFTKDNKLSDLKRDIDMLNIQKISFLPENFKKEQNPPKTIDYSLSFLCSAHNQEIKFFDLNGTMAIENRMICEGCLRYRKGTFTKISEVYQRWEDYKEKQFFYLNKNFQIIDSKIEPLIKLMLEFKEEMSNRINKQTCLMRQRVQRVQGKQNDTIKQQQSVEWSKLNFFQIQEIIETLINPNYIINIQADQNLEFKALNNYIESGIKGFLQDNCSMAEYFQQSINNIGFFLTIDEPTPKKPENTDQVNYQIISGPIIQHDQCDAIILSEDQQVLVAGCGKLINVYSFDQGKLTLKQILKQHLTSVIKLSFIKSSKSFVSVCNNYLLIWIFQNEKWEFEQQLQTFHSDRVQCLLVNENCIITASFDNNIKFWLKKDYWEIGQTLQIHNGQILDMNQNDKQNQIVSCGYLKPGFFSRSNGQIFISEKDSKGKWSAVQTIKSEIKVNRVCYIGDQRIIYQTKQDLTLLVQNSQNIFEIQRILFNISDDSITFPLSFTKSKELLMFKNKNIISVVKLYNDGDYKYQQMIIIQSDNIIGTMADDDQYSIILDAHNIVESDNIVGIMSHDCQYLITWDAKSKQIQVRKSQ